MCEHSTTPSLLLDNKTKNMTLGIIGSGGFAREVLRLAWHLKSLKHINYDKILFVELDDFYTNTTVDDTPVKRFSECDLSKTHFVLGVGDPKLKEKIIGDIPSTTEFTSLISPLAFVAEDLEHKPGLIVMPFTYLSCNVKLGRHVHFNSHCTVGHDTTIDDYVTCACSVMISGANDISKFCYFGMNSSTRQGINITDGVSIGLNAGVVKDLSVPGTYIGTPCKMLGK